MNTEEWWKLAHTTADEVNALGDYGLTAEDIMGMRTALDDQDEEDAGHG